MPDRRISRRRMLVVTAAAAAFPGSIRAAQPRPFEWRGTALGADARLVLWAASRGEAQHAIEACTAEIERLEQIFSLFRLSSEISRLNRDGILDRPSHDMVRLLHSSRDMNRTTDGLFDPTVQRLWEFYADWWAEDPDREPPPRERVSAARAGVGIGKIVMEPGRIHCRNGARITLNGIAQGYITDRVADLLLAKGWRHVLVNLGEVRALGSKPGGEPWRIAVRENGQHLPLTKAALATSAGSALSFGADGQTTHILDPHTGRSPAHWRAVTVRHPSATTADALSTALFAAAPDRLKRVARAHRDARIWATGPDGTIAEYGR